MKTKFPRSALLAFFAIDSLLLAIGLGVLAPVAHAQQTVPVSSPLNECYFDGREHTRNFGNLSYGPVSVYAEKLVNPPNGFGPRPLAVSGLIMPGLTVGSRRPTPEPSSGYNTRRGNDVDPGHVMALHLGGPDNSLNIVPQWARWQRLGEWRQMERKLDAEARKVADESRPPSGGRPTRAIFVNISMGYRSTGNVTPTLLAWSFPSVFLVTAFPVNLDDPGRRAGPFIFNNKSFQGGPPTFRPINRP
jgi:hypothetical protein